MGAPALSYDVAVAGGGTAGLAAAVAAARAGARTVLIEPYGFLGGAATAAAVGTVCGLYFCSRSGPPRPLNDGFPMEVAERLSRLPGCEAPVQWGRTWVQPYAAFAFACLADEITRECRELEVWLHSRVIHVERHGESLEVLRVLTAEGERDVAARFFVDATGDAVVARAAGLSLIEPALHERQLAAVVFTMQGCDLAALRGGSRVAILRTLSGAEGAGLLPAGSSQLALRASPQPGEVVLKLALVDLEAGTAGWMTAAEQEGRRRVRALSDFLRSEVPAFAQAWVSHVAPQVGIREGPRLQGRYTLTREDVLTGRRFDDAVARAAWPIELWMSGRSGAAYEYLEDGDSYDIPLSCLRPEEVDNLFAAGRCLSATTEALGSARVIGTCLAVGAAVGSRAARDAFRGTP